METFTNFSEIAQFQMIESEYRAASSVGSPIPNITSSQTTETRRTEQRWVDSIDEIMAQPSVTREDREVRTAETYAKMVDELMRDVPVQPRTDTRQSREIEDTESLHTSSHVGCLCIDFEQKLALIMH